MLRRMAMASIPRSSARVLRSANPMEPDGAAVPQLLPDDTKRDVGIDSDVPRCSMHFKTANGEWVRCCGQERLFRLPVRDCGQHLRPRTMPFGGGTGGDPTSTGGAQRTTGTPGRAHCCPRGPCAAHGQGGPWGTGCSKLDHHSPPMGVTQARRRVEPLGVPAFHFRMNYTDL